MTEWDLERIIPRLLESGRLALSYFDAPVKEFKKDHSLVTVADRSVEAYLTTEFNQPQAGSFVLGEETIESQTEDYLTRAFEQEAWVIDPIDGTAPYANGLPTWGVSLGWMSHGVLKEGAVFLPVLGELYYSNKGQVFREKTGSDPDLWKSRPGTPQRLTPPPQNLLPGSMLSISQQLSRRGSYRLPFYIQVTGSTVYNLVKLISGSYSAAVTKFKLWDFAACLPMVANLGWTMEFHSGGVMGLDMNSGVIRLDQNDPNRWEAHDEVIFAPNSEVAAYLRAGTAPE